MNTNTEQTVQPIENQRLVAVFLSILIMYVIFFIALGLVTTLMQAIGIPMLLIAAFEFATVIMVYINIDTIIEWGQKLSNKIASGFLVVAQTYNKVKARVVSFFKKEAEAEAAPVAAAA